MAYTDAQANGSIKYGEDEAEVTLAGTVKIGDAVGYSSGWKRALATTGGVIQIRCVAGEDGTTGKKIKVYFGKTLLGGTRLSGGTTGSAVYVAEGTDNGKYTETAPSTSGDAKTVVGYMLSGTEAALIPNHNQDSTA